MQDPAQSLVALTPVLQYGFAGFSLLLLGIIFWLISRLLRILQQTNRVVSANTNALTTVAQGEQRTRRLIGAVRKDLANRPCAFAQWQRSDDHRDPPAAPVARDLQEAPA